MSHYLDIYMGGTTPMPETTVNNVIQFRPEPRPTVDPYFGVCPRCFRNDGWLNVGRAEWAVCHQHKAKWSIGSNLFSDWKRESEEDWARNCSRLESYEAVDPAFPKVMSGERVKATATGELGTSGGLDGSGYQVVKWDAGEVESYPPHNWHLIEKADTFLEDFLP